MGLQILGAYFLAFRWLGLVGGRRRLGQRRSGHGRRRREQVGALALVVAWTIRVFAEQTQTVVAVVLALVLVVTKLTAVETVDLGLLGLGFALRAMLFLVTWLAAVKAILSHGLRTLCSPMSGLAAAPALESLGAVLALMARLLTLVAGALRRICWTPEVTCLDRGARHNLKWIMLGLLATGRLSRRVRFDSEGIVADSGNSRGMPFVHFLGLANSSLDEVVGASRQMLRVRHDDSGVG